MVKAMAIVQGTKSAHPLTRGDVPWSYRYSPRYMLTACRQCAILALEREGGQHASTDRSGSVLGRGMVLALSIRQGARRVGCITTFVAGVSTIGRIARSVVRIDSLSVLLASKIS
jgi:hypothetical protein